MFVEHAVGFPHAREAQVQVADSQGLRNRLEPSRDAVHEVGAQPILRGFGVTRRRPLYILLRMHRRTSITPIVAGALLVGLGCSNTLETGYKPRKLGASTAERRSHKKAQEPMADLIALRRKP